MRSSNPMFRDGIYEKAYALTEKPMTVTGTMNKLLILSLVMIAAAAAVYYQFSLGRIDFVNMLMIIGAVVGFISVLVVAFKPDTTPFLAPIYAFSQGAVISGISCFFEKMYDGIVMQAISLTFIVVFTMALLYRAGLIKATEKFKSIIFTATLSIFIFYLVSFVLFFFHVPVAYFTSTSPVAIGLNVIIAIIAALNLIIDFDFIERGVRTPLPSVFEWYGAFGLLVTILWLYVEILRLLARLRER